ncbi:MAG: response regulator [Actinomycetota bacterium]
MAEERKRIRVLLADGHALFREAVTSVLEGEGDIVVVGDAGEGSEAIAEAGRTHPDCVFLDDQLGALDAVEATRRIKDRLPDCAVILLASEEDEATLVATIEAGASGYLTKDNPVSELIDAVHTVHRGEVVVPPHMLGPLLSGLIRRRKEKDEAAHRMSRLTRREREVLALLADGAGNEGIAETLVISPQTARTHVQNLIAKLGVHSRLEAAMFVARNGMLRELDDLTRATG